MHVVLLPKVDADTARSGRSTAARLTISVILEQHISPTFGRASAAAERA